MKFRWSRPAFQRCVLMMEVVQTSEVSVCSNKTTRRSIPEGYRLKWFAGCLHRKCPAPIKTCVSYLCYAAQRARYIHLSVNTGADVLQSCNTIWSQFVQITLFALPAVTAGCRLFLRRSANFLTGTRHCCTCTVTICTTCYKPLSNR